MSRPRPAAALIIADPVTRRVALGRIGNEIAAPITALADGDGASPAPCRRIGQPRLGERPERSPAFMDAAIRAGFEALGLLIARPAPGGAVPPAIPGVWGRLAQHGLEPDRAALTYLGRAVSPADAPPRWHARIFAAPLSRVSNSVRQPGRMDRLVWMAPEEAEAALDDPALAPFPALALRHLGARPRPALVTFRAGRRTVARL
jgi:hypothetical protein